MLKSLVDRNSNTAILLAGILAIIIAGFGSAMVLIVGASIVMVKLNFEDKTKAMGIHFSGIGFAISIGCFFVMIKDVMFYAKAYNI